MDRGWLDKLLLAAFPFILFSGICSASDSLVVRRVSSDVLVDMLKNELGASVYFIKNSEDVASYSIETTRTSFLEKTLAELEKTGYSVARYDGSYFITSDRSLRFEGLPSDYFSDRTKVREDELSRMNAEENVIATFRNKIYDIGERDVPGKTKAYVRGNVRDITSGEALVGVSVYDEATGSYAVTDAAGFYRIQLPVGENVLCFSGYSMEDLKLNLVVHDDGGLDVQMKEKVVSLKGAVVSAEQQSAHRNPRMGVEIIRLNTIKKVPAVFGEPDILKVVLTMPGVKTSGEASTGFNVRGGAMDQNLILFNDGSIFNPSHMFGVLSAFNADVINDVQLYKSSIPVEYGGRISSVLDIKGKEGNSNKISGAVGLGLLTSNIMIEGPIKKEKTTFVLGGRTTYSDWMLRVMPKSSNYSGGSASFSDLNLGISHKFNENNSLHAYGYWSRDKFGFSADTVFRYSNLNASIKWISHINERNTMTLVGGYDSYSSSLTDSHYAFDAYRLSMGIRQGYLKLGFKTVVGRHVLSYGLNSLYYDVNPGHYDPYSGESLVVADHLDSQRAIDVSAYASDTWTAGDRLTLEYGLRLDGYMELRSRKTYFNPELRLSGKYSFMDNLSLKAGFNTMSQNIHLISNNTSVSPVDTWQLSNERIRPQTGWQAASGLFWTVGQVDLSVEGYYKRMYHYLDYKSGAKLSMNHYLAYDLVETTGRAYGVEFMLRKDLGKLNGWMSYTYSRAQLKENSGRGEDAINGGNWYNASYDKPHDFKMLLNYKFTHRLSLSVNADYSTGRPVTVPIGKYWYANTYMLAYSQRNEYRIPDYFRLDMAFIVEPGHYLRKLTHMSVTFGVYNVTGRKNAYSVYYTANNGTQVNGYMLSVFACPIPYINVNLKF
ncbi:MAG: TonB-dependent receptor [Bacteroidales bacterium]|nr:TonB-dependent receptor [Bacteroidales bacterium]